MTFDWWTFALQTINFLVLVWLLQRLLYRPVQNVIARRKALVEEAFADAESRKQAADAERAQYEQQQAALVESRQELLSRAHAEIEADRSRMLEEARVQASQLLDDARQRMAAERKALLTDTRAEIADLATQMAARVLAEVRSSGGEQTAWSQSFRAQMLNRIAELSREERASLESDFDPDGPGLAIVTAAPLPDAEQAAWRTALEQCFPGKGPLSFTVEPEVLGGVELRFPHAVLSLAWSEMLRRSRMQLMANDEAH